ncbi:MAG TPA: sigma-70 family RNA polymerase sigma factor [Acidobacteriota bacterium]|nr:sigma-70 family RNA polymerase sigma factor [Acidobacteriota bacterium]
MASIAIGMGGRLNEAADRMPSFENLVGEHSEKIFFLALDLTGNHHDAEDLVQEVFIKAYKSLKKFRGEAQFGTWLYRIAVNTHIDKVRKKSEAAMRDYDSWDDERSVLHFKPPADRSPQGNPERRVRSAGIQEDIRRALKTLSPRQHSVFVLRHYQNLKLREIAEVLSCSEGTVKTTLFRAIRRLRDQLAAYRPEVGTGASGMPGLEGSQ